MTLYLAEIHLIRKIMKSICVYCGSADGISPDFVAAARSTGLTLARSGLTLIYGGGRTGLMGAVADGVLEGGGEVVGVIVENMNTPALAHPGLTRLEVTPTIHERKSRMYELADGYIALPGGYGTLDELFETLTWAQIGVHEKPVGLLSTVTTIRFCKCSTAPWMKNFFSPNIAAPCSVTRTRRACSI
jgi:uncharacterized protein (TIGR00730 family)